MAYRRAFFGRLTVLILFGALLPYGNDPAGAQDATRSGAAGAGQTPSSARTTTAATGPDAKKAASVVIVQATAPAALALGSIPKTHLNVPITFEERNGVAAKNLSLRVEPLAHVSGAVPLRFVPAPNVSMPAELEPYGYISGTLIADLPHSGDYASSLRILYNGKIQKIYEVTLSRAAAAAAAPTPLPLDAGELNDILVEVWPLPEQTVVATTTVAPSAAEPITVARPSLRSLTKKLDDKSYGADEATMEVTGPGGEELAFPLTLQPGETQPLRFKIDGIDGGGHYETKIRFDGPGRTAIDKTFVVRAREGWWVALVLTFCGVFGSWKLRQWYTSRRPRLVLERRVAALESNVSEAAAQAPQDPVVSEVAAALGAQITRALNSTIVAENWTDVALYNLLDRKVNLFLAWVGARLAVSRTRPASVASAVTSDMAGVETFLRAPGVSADAVTTHETTVSGIAAKLRKAAETEIRSRVDALNAQLTAILANRPLLKNAIDSNVKPLLERVTRSLDAGAYEEALAGVEEARRQHAIVLANALLSDLGRPEPEMVDPRVWSSLKERLRFPLQGIARAENADEAMRRFEMALATYTHEFAAALLPKVKAALAETKDEARKTTLTGAIKALDGVDAKIGAGNVIDAWNDVVKTHEDVTEFDPRTASSMGLEATPARAMTFSIDESLKDGIAVGTPPPLQIRTYAEVDSELRWGDRTAAHVAIFIAAFIGVAVLWKNSLTWGGVDDYVAAILWGLGVHQLSYNGIASVIDKFAK